MRIVRTLVASCAVLAVVTACFASDPQGTRLFGEDDDICVSVDFSDMLPAVSGESPLLPPSETGSVYVDHRPPSSRLTTAEVFRPPRACG